MDHLPDGLPYLPDTLTAPVGWSATGSTALVTATGWLSVTSNPALVAYVTSVADTAGGGRDPIDTLQAAVETGEPMAASPVTFTVALAGLGIEKTATTRQREGAGVCPGGTITYSVTVTPTNSAVDAILITDSVPASAALNLGSIQVSAGAAGSIHGRVVWVISNVVAANVPNEMIFTVGVANTAPPGSVITNESRAQAAGASGPAVGQATTTVLSVTGQVSGFLVQPALGIRIA